MTQTLEDIRTQLRNMTEAEIVELVSSGRREKQTVTTDTIKAVRAKTKTKNLSSAIDNLSDAQLLRMYEIRKAQSAAKAAATTKEGA